MSGDHSSSNPFRRKGGLPTASTTNPSISTSTSTVNHIAYQQADPPPRSTPLQQLDAPKKITKKVRVQSPSPSIPDSASTIGEETCSIPEKPPTPVPRDQDPFENINSDVDEDESVGKYIQAPANPFSKTLETMEHSGREAVALSQANIPAPGKAALDVDAFKRLLMTGNAGLGTSSPPPSTPAHITHVLGDGGSSTETSSVSRQSIFEAIQEVHGETPRTSHEISEPEDDRKGIGGEYTYSISGRKKPPPPSSRHGKLIKIELRDDPITANIQLPPAPGSIYLQNHFGSSTPSQTDLNKPLPPAPNRASHDSDRESVFDKEAAGKTPNPPSPSSSIRKKTPPTPPITRRHSQLVTESKLSRSNSGRLSRNQRKEQLLYRISNLSAGPRSDSAKAPPPPPSRRLGSLRGAQRTLTTITFYGFLATSSANPRFISTA